MYPILSYRQFTGLIFWLAITFIVVAIGNVASINAGGFYSQLTLPEWAPPASIFGPVWTVLYTLMGIAAWLVWRINGFRNARTALILYLVQLVFNAIWSWFFFGWHLGLIAFADIVFLWVLIVIMLINFWRLSMPAGALILPYLVWVSFAAFLNYTIWQLNPELL